MEDLALRKLRSMTLRSAMGRQAATPAFIKIGLLLAHDSKTGAPWCTTDQREVDPNEIVIPRDAAQKARQLFLSKTQGKINHDAWSLYKVLLRSNGIPYGNFEPLFMFEKEWTDSFLNIDSWEMDPNRPPRNKDTFHPFRLLQIINPK